jgi:hypothetical protein
LLLLVCTSLLCLEAFSFIATKAHLLLFNDTPWAYVQEKYGNEWRTQVAPWGAWHRVNASDRHKKDCFDVTYRSNNFGARDNDFTFRKTDVRPRFFLLGDSFAEGLGVNIEDTAQSQLERRLGIDAYNLGVAQYVGPVQYYLVYKSFAERFEHDGVILLFLPSNDFTDNDYEFWMRGGDARTAYRPDYNKRPDGQFDIVYPPGTAAQDHAYGDVTTLSPVLRFLVNYTFTANTLRTIKYLLSGAETAYTGYFGATPGEQEAAVYFLKKIVAENGDKPMVVLIIPGHSDLTEIRQHKRSSANQPWHKDLMALNGKTPNTMVIDMAPAMPDDFSRFFLACDGHWNAAGHALAADLIAKRLAPLLRQQKK